MPTVGAGGVIEMSQEEVVEEKEAAFDEWVQDFVAEQGLEDLMQPVEAGLSEEEKRRLARKDILDDISLSSAAVQSLARELRTHHEAERQAEQRAEAQLGELMRLGEQLLSLPTRGAAKKVDKGVAKLSKQAEKLARSHAAGLSVHYQYAWTQGRAELHGDKLQALQARMRDEYNEHVATPNVAQLTAPPPRRRSRAPSLGALGGLGPLEALHEGGGAPGRSSFAPRRFS